MLHALSDSGVSLRGPRVPERARGLSFLDGNPTIRQPAAVDSEEVIRIIKRRNPKPVKNSAAYGARIRPAWSVRRLVQREHWSVSDAVRSVVESFGLHPPKSAFNGVRAAYYEIRTRPWSEEPKDSES